MRLQDLQGGGQSKETVPQGADDTQWMMDDMVQVLSFQVVAARGVFIMGKPAKERVFQSVLVLA